MKAPSEFAGVKVPLVVIEVEVAKMVFLVRS